MDDQTITVYDAEATWIAARHREVLPTCTRALITAYFRPGAPTADVGCGSGRDMAWLCAVGFPTVGYDASAGMLAEARRVYPQCDFAQVSLPDLVGVPDAAYANLLCNAVLMHLPRASLPAAAQSLARILAPGGRLLLSYRPSTAADEREPDGRLFTSITPIELAQILAGAGLVLLCQEQRADEERPGVTATRRRSSSASTRITRWS
jgi:SAM-dependent methyltransferase